MDTRLHTQLVLDALNMALWQRRSKDVIHHSDQGSQYTSLAFGLRCKKASVRPSTGSVGDCFDNAMCESFFATVECANCWTATASAHSRTRNRPSSNTSTCLRATHRQGGGTIHIAGIQRWGTTHPQPTKTTINHGLDTQA